MTRSIQVVIALITMIIVGMAHADRDRSEKIRKEYRGSATPNHIVFAMGLFSISSTKAEHPEIATWLVQHYMRLDSEDAAEAFLSRMLSAAAELETEWAKVHDATLCGPDAPRSKEAMYHALDQVDDLREIKSQNVYAKFMSGLDESQQEAMTAWLEEEKEGFYYRTARHESMYENTDYDVVGHVDMVCASRRNER